MARGGARDGAGRKRKLSPEQEQLISDYCNTQFRLIWGERYRRVTEKAFPRLLKRGRLRARQPLNISDADLERATAAGDDELEKMLADRIKALTPLIEEYNAATAVGDDDLEDVLGENRAEDWRGRVIDANYLARIDGGFLPRNIERMPEDAANTLIDADAERGDIYVTFTPSIQSIEAEVKQRAKQALANVGIDVSEKTIGRVWKRDYWPES